MATEGDKVIINKSVIVAAEDKNPHRLPNTRGRQSTVFRAKFFNAFACVQRKANSLRSKTKTRNFRRLQTYTDRFCSVHLALARMRIQLLIDETVRGFLDISSKPAFHVACGAQQA